MKLNRREAILLFESEILRLAKGAGKIQESDFGKIFETCTKLNNYVGVMIASTDKKVKQA